MSKLHERLIKHRHMSLEEKENCNCEMCKDLNVNKTRRKIEIPMQKTDIPEQKSEVTEQKIKNEDATNTEYKYTTLTDTSSGTGVDIKKTYGIS